MSDAKVTDANSKLSDEKSRRERILASRKERIKKIKNFSFGKSSEKDLDSDAFYQPKEIGESPVDAPDLQQGLVDLIEEVKDKNDGNHEAQDDIEDLKTLLGPQADILDRVVNSQDTKKNSQIKDGNTPLGRKSVTAMRLMALVRIAFLVPFLAAYIYSVYSNSKGRLENFSDIDYPGIEDKNDLFQVIISIFTNSNYYQPQLSFKGITVALFFTFEILLQTSIYRMKRSKNIAGITDTVGLVFSVINGIIEDIRLYIFMCGMLFWVAVAF